MQVVGEHSDYGLRRRLGCYMRCHNDARMIPEWMLGGQWLDSKSVDDSVTQVTTLAGTEQRALVEVLATP